MYRNYRCGQSRQGIMYITFFVTNELLTNDGSWQTRTKLDKHNILELLDLCLSTEFYNSPLTTDKFQVHLWDLLFLVFLLKQSCKI